MTTLLLLFLCLIGHVDAENPPDVTCEIVHLQYVLCSWNQTGSPVNYTFSSWFHGKKEIICTDYLRESNINVGCKRPYESITDRFYTFYTVLRNGQGNKHENKYELKQKVKLYPPFNLTVQNGSDLWFYWNQSVHCVESEVQYRINQNKWQKSKVIVGKQSYCINLPSSHFRYELQVRSKISSSCGETPWSEWSKPVVWGSNNSTDSNPVNYSMSVWTPVIYGVSALVLILLVLMLVQNERAVVGYPTLSSTLSFSQLTSSRTTLFHRFRIILVPVVPKPTFTNDIKDWFQLSKSLKDFKANYNEPACPVREYIYVSQSDSKSSDSSNLTVTTDQTNCSVSITVYDPEDPSSTPTS